MKNSIITEFVNFKVLETTTDEQLLSTSDNIINGFHKKQDGFIDAELVKDVEENTLCFIFHYESLEKIKAGGEKMRNSKEFAEFVPLIVPGSINVIFNHRLRKW
jgi:heme-degrading monooxygenase HmoA